ncbi:Platinum sensitivity protein [Orbilia oligospora]|uniref:Platinum sensitivity protein n=1 Tax=Orbilia oligospora TaxID=2813651 RepID=A0A7C8J692_ORBOL|nr:Platinum sensitivity protein [Orbilia oligospora]KAF3108759.1 Platinum sensitivity protein [Orbilia oligospora]KAF3122559.1 Platinum sensitivity protein [Orbilia oligospora]KAF3124063.1 Platinum sensitivity protein [Orbilia oligospora]KAF3151002.1 Platinum sensitivity protein [Orbilia oligospora]
MALVVPNPPTQPRRVKVYELRNNDWFDRGTGYCTGQVLNDEPHIQVKSEEEEDRLLLETRIVKDDGYQKQQETLIVWTEPNGTDMALSFQEPEGCAAIWDFVSHVQNRIMSLSSADDILSDDNEALLYSVKLPKPELSILANIENMMHTLTINAAGRDSLAKFIINDDYIPKLVPLLDTAEDMEMLPELFSLCRIMKIIILLNDSTIIEYIVTDEVVMGVVGILEYDPDFPTHKANHRTYLSDDTRFKEVVTIDNPDIKKKIHQTYRLQYLKDVVLARILDDPTFSVLNSLIFFNQVDIVQHLQTNGVFLKALFELFSSDPLPPEDKQRRKHGVQFLQQCSAIAKNLQGPSRSQLYANFIQHGLFNVIDYALQNDDPATRIAGTEILVCMIDNDPLMMRNFIFKQIQEKTKPLTDTLIELLLSEQDMGVKSQVADAIKVLLDPNQVQPLEGIAKMSEMMNVVGNATRRPPGAEEGPVEVFFTSFYDKSAKKLFKPLSDLEGRTIESLSPHESALYTHLLELLCFFVRHHLFRDKYFILSENIAPRVAQLLTASEKFVQLAALKFFRACVQLNDEFYNRQLIKNKLLEPILNIVIETMPKDNLLNSACLEFFEFIKREGIKLLINHLVEQYRERLAEITYVDTFSSLIIKYDQIHDTTAPFSTDEEAGSRSTVNGGKRWEGLKDLDAAEEEYFNGSDDEDEVEYSTVENSGKRIKTGGKTPASAAGSSPAGGKSLVDYPDDDEDVVMDTTADVNGEASKDISSAGDEAGGIENLNIASRANSVDVNGEDTAASSAAASAGNATPTPSSGTDDHVMTGSLPPTPDRLSEKRRREEEAEDDGMERLLRSTKKRSPSMSKKGSVVVPGVTPAAGAAGKKISINFASKGENGKKKDKEREKEKEKEKEKTEKETENGEE